MRQQQIGTAPNYTNAALTMLGVNFMWVFLTIWAVWGLIPVLIIGWGLNALITLLLGRRS